jgi:hypothetical protein
MEYDPLSSLTHNNRVGPSWRSVAKPIIVCSTPSLQKYRSRTYIWSGNSEIMHRDTLSKGKMWLCSQHPPAEHNAKTCMWYHTATYTIYHYRMHYAHIFFCLQWQSQESIHRSDFKYVKSDYEKKQYSFLSTVAIE